jgi:hypothetical protein
LRKQLSAQNALKVLAGRSTKLRHIADDCAKRLREPWLCQENAEIFFQRFK